MTGSDVEVYLRWTLVPQFLTGDGKVARRGGEALEVGTLRARINMQKHRVRVARWTRFGQGSPNFIECQRDLEQILFSCSDTNLMLYSWCSGDVASLSQQDCQPAVVAFYFCLPKEQIWCRVSLRPPKEVERTL